MKKILLAASVFLIGFAGANLYYDFKIKFLKNKLVKEEHVAPDVLLFEF